MTPSIYNATILAITLIVVLFIAMDEMISNWLILLIIIFAMAFPESQNESDRGRQWTKK